MTTIADLKKQVAEYVKNNPWQSRRDIIKGMSETQFLQKHDVTIAQVTDIVESTLRPGEKRKGDVIYQYSKRGDTFRKVGREYPYYGVKSVSRYSGKNYVETYSVTRYDEPDNKSGYGYGLAKETLVVKKNVPKKWAEQYVLSKLDPSLPRPAKLVGRELMQFGKTKSRVIKDMDKLLSEGIPTQGFRVKDLGSRPVLLFEGANNDVVIDGFLLIHDKDVANNVLEKHIDKLRKAQYEMLRKSGLTVEVAKVGADEYIQEQRGGKFPRWKELVPEIELSGWEPVGTSMLDGGTQVAWFRHDSGKFIAVDVDKLAFIYKQLPGIDAIKSGKSSVAHKGDAPIHTGILVFYQGGKVKALLMTIPAGSVPEKIQEASSPAAVKIAVVGVKELQATQDRRSKLSQASDARQLHSVVIEPDSPRVEAWARDPGRMDVRGIDTPTKTGRKSPKKPRRTHSRGTKPPTSMGGLRSRRA